MTRLQEEVRRTLQEIADVPPPEGLAAAAIRRARTTRRRIVAACAAGAAVIVAAVAFPVALPPVERPAPRWEVAPAPTPERALGPDRWIVSAYGGQLPGNGATDPANWTLLRNPAGGTYRPLAYSLLAASPRGDRVLVQDEAGRLGIGSAATGRVAWLADVGSFTMGGSWSPDGSTIVLTQSRKDDDAFGFVLVDVDRRTAGPLVRVDVTNALGTTFFWAPDGRGIGISLTRNGPTEGDSGAATGLRYFDRSGRPLRTDPVTAGVVRAASDFSPDGANVAVVSVSPREVRVVDARTGAVVAEPGTEGAVVLGWYDDAHLVVLRDGVSVIDLGGRTVKAYDGPPAARTATSAFLAPRG